MLDKKYRPSEMNPFLPQNAPSYSALLNMLDASELYEGLLGYGLFGEKVPPVFSAAQFASYLSNKQDALPQHRHDWIRYRYRRNIGAYREFGIPNPFSYGLLIKHLSDHWDLLKFYFALQTDNQTYRSSRIHVRKLHGTKAVFEMNYKKPLIDPEPIPDLFVDKSYITKCDISQCFPSIYTHALDWALIGKEQAKNNTRGEICSWSHEIDYYAQLATNGETHGLPIGPHASNLLSEIILTRIDKQLCLNGFDFLRYIDDYSCYTESRERAEEFVICLDKYLSEYNLTLNLKKTEIIKLPSGDQEHWVQLLSNYRFESDPLGKGDIRGLLDLAVSCMENTNDAVVLSYSLSMINRHKIKDTAKRYLASKGSHLLYLYPYLLPFAEEWIILKSSMSVEQISFISNRLYQKAVSTRDYLSACYALYFATKYGFDIPTIDINKIAQTRDCLFLLFAWLYAKSKKHKADTQLLHTIAVDLYSKNEMDRFWLFIYEIFSLNDFSNSDSLWRELKKKKITFIDWNALATPEIMCNVEGTRPLEPFDSSDDDEIVISANEV